MSAVDVQASAPINAPEDKGRIDATVPTVCPDAATTLTTKQHRQREQAHLETGLYVKSPNGLRLRSRRVRRLVRKMQLVMPWLQPSDEPTARAWAELEILGSRMFVELDTAGFLRRREIHGGS